MKTSMLDFDKQLDICCKEMAKDYRITETKAWHIIRDFDIEDIVIKHYEDAINEEEEWLEQESEMERKMYNDGWKDHEEV